MNSNYTWTKYTCNTNSNDSQTINIYKKKVIDGNINICWAALATMHHTTTIVDHTPLQEVLNISTGGTHTYAVLLTERISNKVGWLGMV